MNRRQLKITRGSGSGAPRQHESSRKRKTYTLRVQSSGDGLDTHGLHGLERTGVAELLDDDVVSSLGQHAEEVVDSVRAGERERKKSQLSGSAQTMTMRRKAAHFPCVLMTSQSE